MLSVAHTASPGLVSITFSWADIPHCLDLQHSQHYFTFLLTPALDSLCMCVWGGGHTYEHIHVHAHMWRSPSSSIPSTLPFESKSLTEPGAHQSGQSVWSVISRYPPDSTLQAVGYRHMPSCPTFLWELGSRAQPHHPCSASILPTDPSPVSF